MPPFYWLRDITILLLVRVLFVLDSTFANQKRVPSNGFGELQEHQSLLPGLGIP